jgi:N utilization substance protein B
VSRVRRAPRRRSREAALQVLYAIDLAGRDSAAASAQEIFESAAAHFELPEGARAFAKELILGVRERRAAIDARLTENTAHWRIERMAVVDRNVLRLATWELCFTETPTEVVIDEAVELARRFGTERSPGFVNGILDAVARTREQAL